MPLAARPQVTKSLRDGAQTHTYTHGVVELVGENIAVLCRVNILYRRNIVKYDRCNISFESRGSTGEIANRFDKNSKRTNRILR